MRRSVAHTSLYAVGGYSVSYTALVTVFIMSVVRATWATRAARPRVANWMVPLMPPVAAASLKTFMTLTFWPDLPASWMVATMTSMGTVASADRVPPARAHIAFSAFDSLRLWGEEEEEEEDVVSCL